LPHCVLEYSNNLEDEPDLKQLMLSIHKMLADTEVFMMEKIKSRAIKHDMFAVADSDEKGSFVSLVIHILSGRREELKAEISKRAIELLRCAYPKSLSKGKCRITVHIVDIDRNSYRGV
jgi:5-carboxymethyl-2-hydroxymuconate isomerase